MLLRLNHIFNHEGYKQFLILLYLIEKNEKEHNLELIVALKFEDTI